MDVKNIFHGILPILPNPVSETERRARIQGEARASADRDPNTPHEDRHGEEPRRNLSEEELQDAVKYLQSVPGVKDHGLIIRLEKSSGIPVVYVEDPTGKVVRRIPESELSFIKTRSTENQATGTLLNKAM